VSSIGVHGRPSLTAAIVTHLVTRPRFRVLAIPAVLASVDAETDEAQDIVADWPGEELGMDEGPVDNVRDEAPLTRTRPGDDSVDLGQPLVSATWARELRVPRWVVTLATIAFTMSMAATFVTLAVATAGKRTPMIDLQIYRWAGLLAVHSGDLYGGYFPHRHLPFTYPPIAALTFGVMAAIPMPVLMWLITAASISCLTATLWLTWGKLGYQCSARAAATLAAASVTSWLAPVLHTLWLGQINLILMFVIVADLSLADTARFKGVGVGLAAGFKLVPLIFIPYLLLTRRFRAMSVSLVTFALTIAISQILLPGQSQQFWFGGLFLNLSRSGNIAYVGNQSLHGTLVRLMGVQSAEQPYWLVISVIIGVAGLLLAAWTARRGNEMIGILTCGLTGLLISLISWSHHWVWVAPALVVAVDVAVRIHAPSWPSKRSGHGIRRLVGWMWSGHWQRWVYCCALATLTAPFFVLPEGLMPPTVVQGAGAHGIELVTGNLYVIDGLFALCVVGLTLVTRERENARGSG
jgi:alpha-1,2-mannosyltransferase